MTVKNDNNSALIASLDNLVSENQNPETVDIDLLSTREIVASINYQDHKVSAAITSVLPEISDAVDQIVAAFSRGGRLVYIGAGTSGRLGVLDAVECVPTFGVDEGMVVGVLAGGQNAMFKAQEGIEDRQESAVEDLKKIELDENDVLVGIAASGRTPYVIGGLKHAMAVGAKTVAFSCNPGAEIAAYAEINIIPVVGPEALTGSTRMKAGTAQKMVLNMLTTASMIRIGKSYRNLMVDVKATNKKLYARGVRMVMQVTGTSQPTAETALRSAEMNVKLAIMILLGDLDVAAARAELAQAGGFLRKALESAKND